MSKAFDEYTKGIDFLFINEYEEAISAFERAAGLGYSKALSLMRYIREWKQTNPDKPFFPSSIYEHSFVEDYEQKKRFTPEGKKYVGDLYLAKAVDSWSAEYLATEWFSSAAVYGYAPAQFALAQRYYEGRGIAKDEEKGSEWLYKAAQNGHDMAQYLIGKSYFDNKEYDSAISWLKASAEQDNPDAQFCLSTCYSDGLGVEEDRDLSSEWLLKAAQNGHPDAQFSIGSYLYESQKYEDAVSWLNVSAEQGNSDSQYLLCLCYLKGLGVEANARLSAELCAEAARGGNSDAQYTLGTICYDAQDHENAVQWFRAAAEQGHPAAQCELSGYALLENKNGEFLHLLQSSAEQGYIPAVYKLGVAFYFGLGVEKSFSLAFGYFKQAAEAGHAEAQHYLAMMYFRGESVGENLDTAIYWFGKAHSQGYSASTEFLCSLRRTVLEKMKDMVEQAHNATTEHIEYLRSQSKSGAKYRNYNVRLVQEANATLDAFKGSVRDNIVEMEAFVKRIDSALNLR